MLQLLIVGCGGFLGSISRYKLESTISSKAMTVFPIGTFIINILGSFLLGIVTALTLHHPHYYALFGDGFLGAFTTFSTFIYGSVQLFLKDEHYFFIIYILGSILLGVLAFMLGINLIELAR